MKKSIIKLLLQCFGIVIVVNNGFGQPFVQQNDMAHNPFASVLEVKEKKTNIKNSNHLYATPISQKDLLITNPLNRDLSKVSKSKLKKEKKHSKKKNDSIHKPQQKNDNVIENVSIDKATSTQLKQELGTAYQKIELQNLPSKIKVAKKNKKGDKHQEIIQEDKPILVGIVKTRSKNFALIQIDEKRFWVEEGHYLEQSELIEIQEKQVILQKGQEKRILKLMKGY